LTFADSWISRLSGYLLTNYEVPPYARDDRQMTVNYVSSSAPANCVCRACFPSQNSSIIFSLNAGISSGLRLVTSPLSTTTSSLTQLPPAFFTSVLIAGHEVSTLPRTTSASIKTQGP